MPVRVVDIDLKGSVWPNPSRRVLHVLSLKIFLPLVDIVHHQGPMVAATMGPHDRFFALTDQVQLLIFTQEKPSPGKVERRSRHPLELKNSAVEVTASFE